MPLAHQVETCKYLPQTLEAARRQLGSKSASSTNRTGAAAVVDGFMGQWSVLSLHGDVSNLASAEVCSGGNYTGKLRDELKKTGLGVQKRLVIKGQS